MTSVIILALITFLVPPQHQKKRETTDEAKARYSVIAKAISAEAGADKTLALFLLSAARHESAFRRDIHTGKRRGDGGPGYDLSRGADRWRGLRVDSARRARIGYLVAQAHSPL